MPLGKVPDSATDVVDAALRDVQAAVQNANPYLDGSWIKGLITGGAGMIGWAV